VVVCSNPEICSTKRIAIIYHPWHQRLVAWPPI